MLWHKAWVESRIRFVFGAGLLGITCAGAVLFHDQILRTLRTGGLPLETYNAYVYRMAYSGGLRTIFIAFTFVLGLGGLLRERELGTAFFTLALPVSRLRLTLVRAAVGLVEITALALVPAVAIALCSPLVHQAYPLSQSLQFAALWTAGGAALFAVSFLASAMFAGEYTAFIVAWVALFGVTLTQQYIRISHTAAFPYLVTVQEVMSGFRMPYFDAKARVLIGPFPAVHVTILVLIAATLVALAAAWTDRKDF